MSSTNGESSRRPIPVRTLHQPARLSVAQRDAAGKLDAPQSDAAALRQDLQRRAELSRRAGKWADRLMEDTVTLETFKKAVSYLSPQQYREILHERHLNSLCSYPTCPNPPSAAYSANRRYKISTTARKITEKEGNEEEGFCSRRCRVRSRWVEDKVGEEPAWLRGGRGGFELLEELEEKETTRGVNGEAKAGRPQVYSAEPEGPSSTETQDDRNAIVIPPAPRMASIITAQAPGPSRNRSHPMPEMIIGKRAERASPAMAELDPEGALSVDRSASHDRKERSSSPDPISVSTRLPLAATPSSKPFTGGGITDLISNLTIREKTSSQIPPIAPSLTALPAKSPSPTPSPALANRRTSSSLVPTPAKLTSSLLSASRQMRPLPQLAPDSEGEEEGDWGEAEMGLTWGEEDDEMKGFFEQARAAREMMDDG